MTRANPKQAQSVSSVHESISSRLSDVGQRYTDGRRELVDVLLEAGRPLSMPEILGTVTDMPQSSAYRHLTALASAHVVHRIIGTDDHGYFELTDELVGDHHHHVLCGECGKVIDIPASSRLEKALSEAAALAAEETGFDLSGHRIDLFGTCPDCKNQGSNKTP